MKSAAPHGRIWIAAIGMDVPVIPSASRNRKIQASVVPATKMEALISYTINNAFAAFEEDIKGSLTPGKLADITVLGQNILTIDEDEIPNTEIVYTIIGGEVMYAAGLD